jgi:hypothetical protein
MTRSAAKTWRTLLRLPAAQSVRLCRGLQNQKKLLIFECLQKKKRDIPSQYRHSQTTANKRSGAFVFPADSWYSCRKNCLHMKLRGFSAIENGVDCAVMLNANLGQLANATVTQALSFDAGRAACTRL